MDNVLFIGIICIGCFLFYWLLNFLSIKTYRNGNEIIGNILNWCSIISLILSAICLITTIVVLAKIII